LQDESEVLIFCIKVPFRQLHLNKAVWGPEPLDFDPRRFQENPKLAKSPSYRPWGGGHSMCPGRFLAKRSIYAFIALLLARYEVSVETLDGSEPLFPKGDGTKPSPGVEAIAEGEDVVLKLERRSK
jgi:cytochrome P450